MDHESFNLFVVCGLGYGRSGGGALGSDRRHQDRHRLREVEYRKTSLGWNPDDEVAAIEVLNTQAPGLVAKDQGDAAETSIDENRSRFRGRQDRKVLAAAAGRGSGQCVVVSGRLMKALPASAFNPILCTARPAADLRIVRPNRRADELDPTDAEVGRHPNCRAEVSRQRRFHQNQTAHRHRPI